MARTARWIAEPPAPPGPSQPARGTEPGPTPGAGRRAGHRSDRAARRRRLPAYARWCAATGLACGAVVVVLLVGTARRHGSFAQPDTAISRWALAHQTPGWSRLMHDATYLGDFSLMVPVALVLVGIAAAAGARRSAGFVGLAAGSAIAVTWVLERVLGSSPPGGDPLVLDGPGAFPSGHTAVATAVLGALAVVIATSRWPALLRWAFVAVLVVAVVVVGVSRVYDRAHWPSDVLAGWLLSTAWVLAAAVGVGPRWLRSRADS